MAIPDNEAAEEARLLAELHSARLNLRGSTLSRQKPVVSHHELWAHARRAPDAPVAFNVERAIRQDEETARRYRTLLSAFSVAHAPYAIAASDGAIRARRVGAYEIEIIEAEGAPPLLVIRLNGMPPPGMMEASLGEIRTRLSLPEPFADAITLSLDPDHADAATLERMLRDPACEIFLI